MEVLDLNKELGSETVTEQKNKEKNKKNSNEQEPISWQKELFSWVLTFAIAIAAALLLKNYVIINAMMLLN